MARVERLEAEQRSGSTGDGFLLSACTSCTHMLVNLSFSEFPLRNTSVLALCRKPGLSLPFLLGLPTSLSQLSSDRRAALRGTSHEVLSVLFSTQRPRQWGSHLVLCHLGFTPLLSGGQLGATWWLHRGLPAALLAGSVVAAGRPGHRRGKGGSGNRNKIKEKINCFICISGREARARLGSGGRRVEVILGWALRVVQAPQRPQPKDGSLVACKISLSLAAAGLLRRDLCPSGGRLGSHRLEVL